jgi:uncharacterized protein
MKNWRDKLISNIQHKPKQHLLLSLVCFFLTVPGLFLLKQDFSYRIWYSEDDPLLQTFDAFEKRFGNDDNLVIGLLNPEGLYNPSSLQKLIDLTNEVWKIDDIIRVDSLVNFDYVSSQADEIDVSPLFHFSTHHTITENDILELKEKIDKHSFIKGNFISDDGKLAIVVAQVRPSYEKIANNEAITKKARELVKKYSDSEHQVLFTGTSALTYLFKEITEQDISRLIPFMYLVFTLVLWFIYRRKSGILIPYLIISLSILMMLGTDGYLGHEINTLSAVAPNILLTVAIADTVHILTVYFFGLFQGFSNHLAVRYSLTKNFYPTLLTSITTAIGFFSFAGAKIGPVAQMGISVGFGVLYAWLCTYLMIGAILQLMPSFSKKSQHHEKSVAKAEEHITISARTSKQVAWLERHALKIVISSLVMAIVSLYYASQKLEVNLDPYTQFPQDHQFNRDIRSFEKHLGSVTDINFMIDAKQTQGAKDPAFLKKVEQFDHWLKSQDYVLSTSSLLDILKDINKTLNGGIDDYYRIPDTMEEVGQSLLFYSMGLPQGRDINNRISHDERYLQLVANWSIHTSKEANHYIQQMESTAKSMDLDLVVTGKVPLFHDLTPYVVSSFLESFIMAFSLITIILIIVLRSLGLGLLALVPNIFPLICGAAIYALSGEYVDMASVLIASVCLGIAVDDSIHFLFEYKKYRAENHSVKHTIELIFTNTAPSLVNTTLIIMLGFGMLYFAHYVPNAKFGVMVAIILFIALCADLLLLPAILFLSEKKKHA